MLHVALPLSACKSSESRFSGYVLHCADVNQGLCITSRDTQRYNCCISQFGKNLIALGCEVCGFLTEPGIGILCVQNIDSPPTAMGLWVVLSSSSKCKLVHCSL